jgi:putative addiction module antidote
MNALELVEMGDSLGVILPQELLARLKVGDGDTLFLTETAQGITLTTTDAQLMGKMLQAKSTMQKRQGGLRKLSK